MTPRFVFFGTGPLAESALIELCERGFLPVLLVTKPNTPQGRGMELAAPHIKKIAERYGIPVTQPTVLDEAFLDTLREVGATVFIVASYGKILPEALLNIPSHGALNIHPSLLPRYRGASPIESAILAGEEQLGISIMKLDTEMDHGPLLLQESFLIDPSATAGELEVFAGEKGGSMLAEILEGYVAGEVSLHEQDHTQATLCKKLDKSLGEISLSDSSGEMRRKYRALMPWPGLYFFVDHKGKRVRVKVTSVNLIDALENGTAHDVILRVIPEGKKEMSFEDFKRGYLM